MSVFSKVYEQISSEIQQHEDYRTLTTEQFLTTLFYSTVIASFSYEGNLPKFIKPIPSYIEECLFGSSKIAFFEHEGEHYITPCYASGILLDNGLYSTYTCIFRNGRTLIKKLEEIEICDNMSLGLPSRVLVDEILQKCITAMRAVDVSLERASMPALTFANDENLVNQITIAVNKSVLQHNPMALIAASTFKGDTLNKYDLFDNRAQDVLALWDIFVRYKNLFFTTFGINNVEISKTERLTRAEGESNTEITRYAIFYDMYEHRVDWLKRVKEHFGVSIKCNINRNYETVSAMTMTNEEKREMNEMVIAPYARAISGRMNPEQEEVTNDRPE